MKKIIRLLAICLAFFISAGVLFSAAPKAAAVNDSYRPGGKFSPIIIPDETPGSPAPVEFKVTKSPTSETVEEGGDALFIAHCDGDVRIVWRIVSPDTTITYSDYDAQYYFSGLEIYGVGTDELALCNIPYAMNGWRVEAKFFNADNDVLFSNAATIYVTKRPAASPTPSPRPTPSPTPSASPAPSAMPIPSPSSLPSPSSAPIVTDKDKDGGDAAVPAQNEKQTAQNKKDHTLLFVIGGVLAVGMICGTVIILKSGGKAVGDNEEDFDLDIDFDSEDPDYDPRHDGINDKEDYAEYLKNKKK